MHVSDVVAASGITASALLAQAALTNWREAVRLNRDSTERQKDRDHQAVEAAKVRSQGVEDHWRDERLTAHAEYLAAVEALSKLANYVSRATPAEVVEVHDAVRDAWTRVQMLGSTDSTEAGSDVYDQCQNIAYYAMRAVHTDPKDEALVEVDGALGPLSDLLRDYRLAARRDIGTEA